jgi:hypothetical protein
VLIHQKKDSWQAKELPADIPFSAKSAKILSTCSSFIEGNYPMKRLFEN